MEVFRTSWNALEAPQNNCKSAKMVRLVPLQARCRVHYCMHDILEVLRTVTKWICSSQNSLPKTCIATTNVSDYGSRGDAVRDSWFTDANDYP